IFAYMLAKTNRAERSGHIAALLLIAQVILVFIFYVQMQTSLTLFALRNVDPRFKLFGTTLFTWSPAQFQALTPSWIMLLSPVLVA
ncbi:MFS transporter, partial [Burkholderia pseudomallei]